MAIRDKRELKHRPIEIDLTGPDGNVFVLMGTAKRLARQLWERGEFNPEAEEEISFREAAKIVFEKDFKTPESMGDYIVERMMESDYENAVNVFDHYFGNFVILYR